MSLSGPFVIVAVDSEPVHGPHPFEIEFADGTVHGRVLNRFSGGATLEGDTIVLGAIAATRMAGPPELMAVEDSVFRVLSGTLEVDSAEDGTITLSGDSGSLAIVPAGDGIEDAGAAL
jgi:heat shock protein HslJ